MLLFMFICLALSISCLAQSSPFDLSEYQEFLDQHRNMTASELLQLHSIGSFKDDVNIAWGSVLHHDVVEAKYELTDDEKALLRSNGFVVSERLRNDSFAGPVMSYYEITTTDFHRLTDEEWENIYLPQATRPAWTSSFLANESGESY